MNEKPIIFSTQMVQAILDGRKTQTRRVVKINCEIETDKNDKTFFKVEDEYGDGHDLMDYCPYQIGQTLWVRETFVFNDNPDSKEYNKYEYKVDYEGALCQDLITWKPSIFMPRKAARIFLKVTNIRVERLQDISKEDAKREGCSEFKDAIGWYDERVAFCELWDSLNKKRGYGWDDNPLVWVIKFERIGAPE